MNIPDGPEVHEKIRRIYDFFDKSGYEAMIIGRKDNFAWLTCGGNNSVIIPNEAGVALLVVTTERKFVVARMMDGARIQDEELSGLGFENVFHRWYEASLEEKSADLVRG